jgi:hypothetical protein
MIRLIRAVLAVTAVVIAYSANAAAQPALETASKRIAELSSEFENLQGATPREASRRDDLAKAIRSEVERFIQSSVRPIAGSDEVQSKLRSVLRAHVPGFDTSDPPKARVVDLRYGRSLVIAYSVVRPPHFDLPTITAFAQDGGEFRLAAKTGEDFEGHTLATIDVASPVPGVMWILASGRAFGFNGSKSRFRLYAFDGNTFETVWAKDDVFSATAKALPDGFELTHYVRELQSDVTEQYRSTPSGVVRVR